MEKSLESIEKSLSSANGVSGEGASGVVSGLSSITLSITTIARALSTKGFKKRNADTILSFVQGISSFTKDLNADNLRALGNFATGISSFVKTLSRLSLGGILKIALMGKLLFDGEKPLLGRIVNGAIKSVESFSGKEMKKLKDAGVGISLLANGLKTLTKAMALLGLVAVGAPLILMGAGTAWLVVKMFVGLGAKAKEIKKGGEAIRILAKGLTVLAGSIALMTLLTMLVKPAQILEIVFIVSALSLTFALVGRASSHIARGAWAVKKMGMALGMLAAGIAMISLVVLLVPVKHLLMGMMLVAGYGLVFALIGRASKYISEGALAMILGMSLGLFFFSGALLVFSMAMKVMTWDKAFLGIVFIGAMAALFYLLGKFDAQILGGAKAMAEMAIGLAAFSVGIILFALAIKGVIALFKNDWQIAALATVGIIGGLGILFGVLGTFAGSIAQGAIAVGLIGAGLAVFSVGLILYALALKGVIALFNNNWEVAAAATAGIIVGLGGLFALLGVLVLPIALGAASMALMGASLAVFSVGLMIFSLAMKAVIAMDLYDEKEKTFKGVEIIKAIAKGIASLAWYAIPIAIATPVALGIGASLNLISAGLLSASKAIEKIPDAKEFTDKLFAEKSGIIPSIAEGFASIYKRFGGGFLGALRALTGTDPVTMGVRITRGIGSALEELAGGIAAFADFEKFPVRIPSKDGSKLVYTTVDLFKVASNIQTNLLGSGGNVTGGFLYTIADIFGKIGEAYPEGGFFSDSPVQDGIDAVKGMGDALSSIAGGIVAFSNFKQFPIQVPDPKDPSKLIYSTVDLFTIPDKIKEVLLFGSGSQRGFLYTLADVFAAIGEEFPGGNWWSGDSAMEDGLNAVKSMGETLSSVASGIMAFANSKAIPVEFDPKTGKPTKFQALDLITLTSNIKSVISAIPDAFASISEDTLEKASDNVDTYEDITEGFLKLGSAFGKVKDSFFLKGEKGEDKGMLSMLASEISNFTTAMAKPLDMASLINLTMLGSIFENFGKSADPFSKFVDSFEDFVKSFGTFSTDMGTFAKNFRAFNPMLNNYTKFAALLNGHAVYGSRFVTWESGFNKMSKDMEMFAKNFKLMDKETIQAFEFWTKALTEFVKISPDTFQDVADAIISLKEKLPSTESTSSNVASNTPAATPFSLLGSFNQPQSQPQSPAKPTPSQPQQDLEPLVKKIEFLATSLASLPELKNSIDNLVKTLTTKGLKIAD